MNEPMIEEELEGLVRERIASRQFKSDRELGDAIESVGWMTFAPYVPTQVLLSAAERDGVEQLAEAGVLMLRHDPFPRESSRSGVYASTATARSTVLEYFSRSRGGFSRLRDLIAASAYKHRKSEASAAPAWNRWIKLASAFSTPDGFAATFDDAARAAFTRADAAELLNLIECARPLVDLATRTFDEAPRMSLERAARQLELLQRRVVQERNLRTFLPRSEQIAAINDLLNGPDEQWALHLFGVGGMGKTMLLNAVIGRLVPQLKASVARVDFDYLNPDYPRLNPGLLLWSFAQELRPYDVQGRANDLFDQTDHTLRLLSSELRASAGTQAQEATLHPLFLIALTSFIDALRALPQPVILILDTCEELSKMRADGHVPDTVEETFRILCAIHDGPAVLRDDVTTLGLPGVRVIFAGRRPLACAGVDWQFAGSKQPARPYLKLHHLLGFTTDEARDYLTSKMQIPPALIDAVIERSRSVGVTNGLQWRDGRSADRERRCNPFDLRLYADWAREEPPPTAEQIRSATSAEYVEMRILRRLDELPSLRAILPMLAQIKFADATLIARLVPEVSDAERTFDTLREQEWVEERRLHAPEGASQLVLCLEERLRRRLWTYFRGKGEIDQRQLALTRDYLQKRTLDEPLEALDWTLFDAAARAFAYDIAAASNWWLKVERRILAERDHRWLWEITRALLSDSEDIGEEDDESARSAAKAILRALLLSAYLTACRQIAEAPPPDASWPEVRKALIAMPAGAIRNYLERRAKANITARAAQSLESSDGAVARSARWMRKSRPWPRGSEWMQVQCAASTLEAHSLLLDRIERSTAHSPQDSPLLSALRGDAGIEALAGELPALIDALRPSPPMHADAQRLVSFSYTLLGRLHAITGNAGVAIRWFQQGIEAAQRVERPFSGSLWDWRAPENALARAVLEYVRRLPPNWARRRTEIQKLAALIPSASDIDSDRLHSLLLQLRLAEAPQSEIPDAVLDLTPAQCFSHETVMPLALTAAAHRGRLDPDDGLEALDALALRAGLNIVLVLMIEREKAKLLRRLRLTAGVLGEALRRSERPEDQQLVWSFEAHTAKKHPPQEPDASGPREALLRLHALWQSKNAISRVDLEHTLRWGEQHIIQLRRPDPKDNFAVRVSLELDRCELRALASRQIRFVPERLDIRVHQATVMRHPAIDEQASFALALRCLALNHITDRSALTGFIYERAEELGNWRAAEIAMDLGDSLMLRLPAQADAMFQLAHNWYTARQDWVGAFIAAVRLATVASDPSTASYRILRAWSLYGDRIGSALKASTAEGLRELARSDSAWPNEFTRTASPALRPTIVLLIECTLAEVKKSPSAAAGMIADSVDFEILSQRRPPTSQASAGVAQARMAQAPRAGSPPQPASIERLRTRSARAAAPTSAPAAATHIVQVRWLRWIWVPVVLALIALVPGLEIPDLSSKVAASTARTLSSRYPVYLLFGAVLTAVPLLWRLLSLGSVVPRWFVSPHCFLHIQAPQGSAGRREARTHGRRFSVVMIVNRPTLRWPWQSPAMPDTFRAGSGTVLSSISERRDGRTSAAIELDFDIVGSLQLVLRKRFGPRPLVRLEATAAFHEYRWESTLYELAGPRSGQMPPVRCVRVVPSPHRVEYHAPARRALLVLASSPRQFALTDSLVRNMGKHGRLASWHVSDVNSGDAMTHSDPRPNATSVVYMVGRVDEGSSGLVFQSMSEHSIVAQSPEYAHLLPAPAVVRAGRVVELAIFQAEPGGSSDIDARTVSERNDEALARTYAAQLSEAGARYVLYLPRMTIALAARILELLVEFLATEKFSEKSLLTLVDRLHALIQAQGSGEQRRVVRDLAAGIALFSRQQSSLFRWPLKSGAPYVSLGQDR